MYWHVKSPFAPIPMLQTAFPQKKSELHIYALHFSYILYISCVMKLRTYIFINAPVNIEKNIPLLHSLLFKMVYIVLLPFWMTNPLYDRSQPFVKVLLKVWQEDKREAKSKVGWLHEICKQTMNVNLKVTFQFSMLNIYLCYRTLFFVGKLFENTMGRISDSADKASNF